MPYFRGTYQHTLDKKGRLAVPNRFREVIRVNEDNRLVVTRGTHKDCLSAFTMETWHQIEEQVSGLPAGAEKDAFVRHFISPAIDCNLDKMGRILIPIHLREERGLDHEVMVVGALSKFEIWDRERWEGYQEATHESALQLLDKASISF